MSKAATVILIATVLLFTSILLAQAPATAPATAPAMASTTAPTPRIGVRTQMVADGGGVQIVELMIGFAAEASGLMPGDVIVRVGEQQVTDSQSFRAAVARIANGQTAPFRVMRNDQMRVIPFTMNPPRPDAPGAQPPIKPELRAELLAMLEKDRAQRRRFTEEPNMHADEQQKLIIQLGQDDRANRARLKEIIAQHGFPTISMVGDDAADVALLIVQNSDNDPQWQGSVLSTLDTLAKKGEARRWWVANLIDRHRMAHDTPQLYGTEMNRVGGGDGELIYVPPVVEDPKNLDKRRMEMGLGPWATFEAQMAKMQHREPFASPRGPEEK